MAIAREITKKTKGKTIIYVIKQGAEKIEKIVLDLKGNLLRRKNFVTGCSVNYAGRTPEEVDATHS